MALPRGRKRKIPVDTSGDIVWGHTVSQLARRDVLPTTEQALSEALFGKYRAIMPANPTPEPRASEDVKRRLAVRQSLLEPRESDPTGHERIFGESDLTSINYLDRGRRAADAVCRVRAPAKGAEWYGTGFLVGPRLLVTNHHVLGTEDEAGQAEAEFGFEHDLDGVLKRPMQFNLQPHELFFTDPALDVTFVAVAPLSDSGIPIERFGWLQLLPPSGKGLSGEWVTIIQHPNGGPKQISIRSNRITDLPPGALSKAIRDSFVHYLTDTEPGSSGAPVLNDQWQVVALHHKAVPAPRELKKPGGPQKYIANEGVRISSIYQVLEDQRFANLHAGRALDRLEEGLGLRPIAQVQQVSAESALESDGKPFAITRWKKASGYDPNFLSERIELGPIYAQYKADGLVAPLLKNSGHELTYNRFSVVVHEKRKFALITAVNIRGDKLIHPGSRPTVWRIDGRMDAIYQPAGNFYEKSKGRDKVQFSRGHLVRRFDPCWGGSQTEAKAGDEDTFHYSNAAPQFQRYNDVDWGNLEDYVLDRAQMLEKKLTVFQGPIFRPRDPWYGKEREDGPWRIPLSYWKVAVLQKDRDTISAAAFMIGQKQYLDALYEAKVFQVTPYTRDELQSEKIQTTIATIEEETGLDFSAIRKFDSQGGLESTRRVRPLTRLSDIII